MAAVAGTAFWKTNGVSYRLRANFNIAGGNTERESVVGIDTYHGFIQKPAAAFIEADFTDDPAFDLNVLNNLTGVTITVELINGKRFVMADATQMLHVALNVADGSYKLRFEAANGEYF